jgi:hypothetical protein
MALRTVCGVMPLALLYATCLARRRSVSSIAAASRASSCRRTSSPSPPDVAGGAPHLWISARRRAKEPLLVGVEDAHERHLGQVEPLAQEVHADEHVELALAQVGQDLMRSSVSISLCR